MALFGRGWIMAGAMLMALTAGGTTAWAGAGTSGGQPAHKPTIAVLNFGIVNTSLMPTTKEEYARLAMLQRQLAAALQKSGRYQVVSIAPIRAELAKIPNIPDCNGCELPLARKVGADLVAVGIVQKVSNLILSINLVIENSHTGAIVKAGTVDIRDNTTVMWQRGLAFLLSDRILG